MRRQQRDGARRGAGGAGGGLAGALLAAVLAAGCGGQNPARQQRGTASSPWVIGFSQCTLNEPWRVEMNRQLEEAAGAHPDIRLLLANAEDKSERQVNDVENFLAQGIDLLIISPKEAAPLTDVVAKVFDQGIPAIVLDRKVLGEKYTCFIGADNLAIGRAAGRHALELLGGTGTGVIVELKGNMSSTPGEERHRGFREAVAEALAAGRLQVVHEADCDWKEDRARLEMEAALAAHERIDLVYGHNDPMAHGAWVAARQAGRAEAIRFLGIDALPKEGLAYVREGLLDATLEYPTGAREAVAAARALLSGGSVPRSIGLGTRLYTPDNVAAGGVVVE